MNDLEASARVSMKNAEQVELRAAKESPSWLVVVDGDPQKIAIIAVINSYAQHPELPAINGPIMDLLYGINSHQ